MATVEISVRYSSGEQCRNKLPAKQDLIYRLRTIKQKRLWISEFGY